MSISRQDAEQIARMTLRQYAREEKGLEGISIEFLDLNGKAFGYALPTDKKIQLDFRLLQSEALFVKILKHEIAHFIDYAERGTFKRNGKNDYHGSSFKKVCRRIGADPSTHFDSIILHK